MKYSRVFYVLLFFLHQGLAQNTISDAIASLQTIIHNYEEHKGYDEKVYPLGLFSKEHYASEADFAKSILLALSKVSFEL
ncbi:MAG: hypothetical protein ACJAQ7_001641, partial [Sediminicola sp.]